jgi:citrate lyase subunit beta/citryl-CoA lyase
MATVLKASVDGIILPKLETAADLQTFEGDAPIIGLIETARGVANVEALADQGRDRLLALAFGAEDFITDIGGRRTLEGLEVLFARSRRVRSKWRIMCSRRRPRRSIGAGV